MTTWTTLYTGTLDGRDLTLLQASHGSYKVLTQQKFNDVGIAYQDGPTYVHVSPSSAGEAVESEVMSLDSLAEAMRELHFSAEAVSALMAEAERPA
ncbi:MULTISPECIES: hypothetical protein [Dyella]|uniref:Uncharacterized protein n=2 Tax=Dyella TaxID=231454 RepID=A0A4R0YXY2_9GAMM|nr:MULTISPECIES: hypothetical protein [Dyella]TBR38948.1 hypothetical protein EYV96_01470 [Dyella terrae]TCI13461.1 hypothetical protein EZM97_09400 [Dyella soli]